MSLLRSAHDIFDIVFCYSYLLFEIFIPAVLGSLPRL